MRELVGDSKLGHRLTEVQDELIQLDEKVNRYASFIYSNKLRDEAF